MLALAVSGVHGIRPPGSTEEQGWVTRLVKRLPELPKNRHVRALSEPFLQLAA